VKKGVLLFAIVLLPAPQKPDFDTLLKTRSRQAVLEEQSVVTNAHWSDDDFSFVNAMVVRTPFRLARPRFTDYELFPRITDAIKKLHYDPATKLIEIVGEAGGMRMHSWIKVAAEYSDGLRYEFVRGDLTGFVVRAYLWERGGQTLAYAEGHLPGAKSRFPGLVALAFPTVSEVVIDVASKNFRKFLEEDYNSKRIRPGQ
jgi:hypothetical protein